MKIDLNRFDSLEDAMDDALRTIDEVAGEARSAYISSGAGQDLEYESVFREARSFHDDPSGEYPLLEASVEVGEADTIQQAADLVLSRSQDWKQIGKKIRIARLKAKREVLSAQTQRDVTRARDNGVSDLRNIANQYPT